ncbi:MAG: hypothetical protein Q9193_004055 [Seirophora villosa]
MASRPFLSTTPLEPIETSGHDMQSEDTDFLSPVSAENEGVSTGHVAPKTDAEIRAEKRKMKRFRLTHNQTRFLMSEYARQAHPDAAQRERLSREIPGLSPRQVQVWFQNRRAKLKRLTVDDQESMLKSRALPIGFGTTQPLHHPYDAPSMPGSDRPSSFFHPTTQSGFDVGGPIATGRLRSASEAAGFITPASISSSLGNFYSTSGSISTSEMISPTSPSSDRSRFFTPPISHGTSPHMQPSSIRPRAASLALPSLTIMSHLGAEAEIASGEAARLQQENPFQHYPQYTIDTGGETRMGTDMAQTRFPPPPQLGMPFDPVVHGGPSSRFLDGVAGHSSYNPSYSTNTTAYPRRASESVIVPRQHMVPMRPPQSAPLPAPAEFPSSYQFNEAGLPTVPTYDYTGQRNGYSQNDHHTTYYDMENLSLLSDQSDCEHEEEFEISCSFFEDANHVHNTVVLCDPYRPSCSICHPPTPLTAEQIRCHPENLPERRLPGPGSIQALFRGYHAEILSLGGVTDGRPAFPLADGGAVNGAVGYTSHRSMDTIVNANQTSRGSTRSSPHVPQGGFDQGGSDQGDPSRGSPVVGGPAPGSDMQCGQQSTEGSESAQA